MGGFLELDQKYLTVYKTILEVSFEYCGGNEKPWMVKISETKHILPS